MPEILKRQAQLNEVTKIIDKNFPNATSQLCIVGLLLPKL